MDEVFYHYNVKRLFSKILNGKKYDFLEENLTYIWMVKEIYVTKIVVAVWQRKRHIRSQKLDSLITYVNFPKVWKFYNIKIYQPRLNILK